MYRHALWLLLPFVCLAQPASYTISTYAGQYNLGPGFAGDGAAAAAAQLNNPIGIALDASHNLYIADSANQRIRKVAASNGFISTFAGTLTATWTPWSGDGGAATASTLFQPNSVWVDQSGSVFIADLKDEVVRKVSTTGIITTVAGNNFPTSTGDGGQATSASMTWPCAVVGDNAGNLYISACNDNRVRRVGPDGTISTYAGNGVGGFGGDGGKATSASLHFPYGLAMDPAGNLYIADSQNNRIRKVATDGTITTVAGTGTAGAAGDGGPATGAQLKNPYAVAVDPSGSIIIADYGNNVVRRVTPDGIINRIAGGPSAAYAGDGLGATFARLNSPAGLAVDTNGNIYVADSSNWVIRVLTPVAPAVSGGGVVSASAFGGQSTVAPGSWIEIYGSGLSLSDRSWAGGDFSGNTGPTSLDGTTVTIGGQPAYIDFVSGGQINAQVPSNVSAGAQAVVVKNQAGTSAATNVTVNATSPGLLAGPAFNIGGTQFAGATFTDGTTFVLPAGSLAGVTSRAAKVGDIITLYGVGFGPVSPAITAGQIATQSNSLTTPLQVFIGGKQAALNYYGLSPNSVGLYQFNVMVPSVASGNAAVTFTLGATNSTQTLFIPVQ